VAAQRTEGPRGRDAAGASKTTPTSASKTTPTSISNTTQDRHSSVRHGYRSRLLSRIGMVAQLPHAGTQGRRTMYLTAYAVDYIIQPWSRSSSPTSSGSGTST
jgi:hypothetical protein